MVTAPRHSSYAPLELDLRLDEFERNVIAEFRRVTWRTTWACAAIAAVMNTALVVGVLLMR